jgi:hypothetical protein
MKRGTLAVAIAFSAGLLACSSGAGNSGTSNTGGAVDTGGLVGTGGVQTGGSQATSCGICSAGLVCERYPPAVCADPNWDEWPVPNSQVDVTAGAPNLESYTDNGDSTVTDNVTGLMWQQAVPATQYDWADAVAYCTTLTLAGHSDWRLPSVIELVSIVDFGQYNPSITPTYFPSTPSDFFWSAAPAAGIWCSVNFYDGSTGSGLEVSDHAYVRCVR